MTTPEIERLAGGLSPRQVEALLAMREEWRAGPHLKPKDADQMAGLRSLDLIEREFADMAPPKVSANGRRLRASLSACWHFRLTPLGLSLREYLKGQDNA